MGRLISGLVAVTCVVIIAAVGLWTWRGLGYDAAQKDASIIADCKLWLSDQKDFRSPAQLAKCEDVGAFSDSDLRSAGLKLAADAVTEFRSGRP